MQLTSSYPKQLLSGEQHACTSERDAAADGIPQFPFGKPLQARPAFPRIPPADPDATADATEGPGQSMLLISMGFPNASHVWDFRVRPRRSTVETPPSRPDPAEER